jgi:hypothetical protein
MIDRCDGRYPVPHKREEPFPVTYRCALPMGHDGPHGDGNDRSEPIEQPAQDRLQPMAPGAPDIPALRERLAKFIAWTEKYPDWPHRHYFYQQRTLRGAEQLLKEALAALEAK